MEIRQYQKSDFMAVQKLFKNELGYEINENHLDAMLKLNFFIYVAIIRNQLVGFIGVETTYAFELENKIYRVIALAVDATFIHQGIGKQLIDYVEKIGREQNVCLIAVSSNLKRKEAHLFYEHMGFNKTGYRFIKKIEKG